MTEKNLPKTLIAFLLHVVKPQLKWFLCLMILPCAGALELIVFPYCTKLLIDTIIHFIGNKTEIYPHIFPILYFGLTVWILLTLASRFLDIVYIYFIPRFQSNIRLSIFKYIQGHSHKYFSNELPGGIANKIGDISNSSWGILSFIFRNFSPISFSIFASIIILGIISIKFSIIFILFYLSHISICFCLSKKCSILSDIHSGKRNTLQGNIVDSVSNIINVRLFSRYQYELNYIDKLQNEEIDAHERLLWSLFLVRLILEIPSLLTIIGTIYFLVKAWQLGTVSTGDFAFVITLSFSIIISVWRLGSMFPDFFKEIGICQQALSLIKIPYEIKDLPNASELVVKQGKIVFDNVNFDYTPGIDLFENKSIIIEAGEKVGLVGFSGSGKSTFVNLILRHFEIRSGKILIDEQDISVVSQDSLRNNIAMIPQDVTLFHRTLMENIRYGNLNATQDQIIEASKKAYCHEFIVQLEHGYNTLVGERGIKLSGGQRQRIAIARAMLKNSPILILDEATSALDSITEKYIQDSLSYLMKGRTTIIIAHRLSTLLGVDKILVFHNGKIIEQGRHQNLLEKQGHYAKLWSMQLQGFLPNKPITELVQI